jgi:hypothetical protein
MQTQILPVALLTFLADSSNPALDFRNPENFYHDVNSVTGLLKQFFRDLPNPLLTTEHHASFIEAASEYSYCQDMSLPNISSQFLYASI